jgi:excisionase family DNA binding protein
MDDAIDRAAEAKRGSPFLTTDQAAFYVGLTNQTLRKMRRDGRGPHFRRHGRFVRYHIDDLDEWSKIASVGDRQEPDCDDNASGGEPGT